MATTVKPRPTARPKAATPPVAPEGEDARQIEYIDPAAISRDDCNARESDTEPDEDLLNSVREIGVEEPVSVRPRPDGTFGAFKGWRRVQAAQIANSTAEQDGRPQRKIPAYMRPDLVGRDGWTRMLSLIENAHRKQMTERDKLKATELALIDMTEAEQNYAVRTLGVSRNAVKAARKAQRLSDAELRSASAGGMDLEQMADSADVADVPGAQHFLSDALAKDAKDGKGGRGHWDQAMARLRMRKAEAEAEAKTLQMLEDEQIPLLHTSYYGKDLSRPLSELTTPLGASLTADKHRQCPGHSARLGEESEAVWHCADPKKHGHKVRPEAKAPKTPMDPAQQAHRSKVIEGNRAWAAAQVVRRDFMARICQGKKLPDKARLFTFRSVMSVPEFYARWTREPKHDAVAKLLGAKVPEGSTGLEEVRRMAKAREGQALFAHIAAACEESLSEKKVWMYLGEHQATYVLLYEALGGTLSEVEEMAVAQYRTDPATGEDGDGAAEGTTTPPQQDAAPNTEPVANA
ncbi:ParB/RepB/Spo0J family partition protein [Streptomyces kronopolitis]|uniref:ParB/RepB/Spo0J family partition protein n=1 Tax=Streptomyces kronopolitis TaxID=1612435 RepID=UPI0036BFD8F5